MLVLRSRLSLQSTPMCQESVGLIRCCQTQAYNTSVKHDTTNLSRRISNPAHAMFRHSTGHRKDHNQSGLSTRAQGVQRSQYEEGHLQNAARQVLSLRSELDSLRTKQLSAACSGAINKLDALCQSGHHEEVAAALAQVHSCNQTIYRPYLLPREIKSYGLGWALLLSIELVDMTECGHRI